MVGEARVRRAGREAGQAASIIWTEKTRAGRMESTEGMGPEKRTIYIRVAQENPGLAGATAMGVFPISIGGASVTGAVTIPIHRFGGITGIPAGCIQV